MPKRSRFKRETEESKALKSLRIKSGLSQREIARIMGVPQTRVAHAENGRAYIKKEYIELFLRSLKLNWEEWDKLIDSKENLIEVKEECKLMIDKLSEDKLIVLKSILISF